jgi:uncharacterized protein YdeI (YjbR/CyaY-like superfamily)
MAELKPTFFATPIDFRRWLKANHKTASELLVGFHKKDSGKPSITWPESVDQALCFGWIDGVRRSMGRDSYCIQFTPRKPVSIWSRVNIERFKKLQADGLAAEAGEKAFNSGRERTEHYSYENSARELPPDHLARFQKNPEGWVYFQACAPSYRKRVIWWVISAKQATTRERRLSILIEASIAGRRLDDK